MLHCTKLRHNCVTCIWMRLRTECRTRGIKRSRPDCSMPALFISSSLYPISCYFLHRMILLHFVSFVCASAHVLTGTFGSVMASLLLGYFGEFDPSSETFTAYLERLDQFFVANDIGNCADDATSGVVRAANQIKITVMISVIDKKKYSTLRDFCSPENPKEKPFQVLCELLQQHFKPKRSEVAESYRFHRCCQEENESVSVYSARLRHLAATCNFGVFLKRSLRDQFVCGIRNPATRKKLLSEDRRFQEALQVAIADEIAAKEFSALPSSSRGK